MKSGMSASSSSAAGGETLHLVEGLNDSPRWIAAILEIGTDSSRWR